LPAARDTPSTLASFEPSPPPPPSIVRPLHHQGTKTQSPTPRPRNQNSDLRASVSLWFIPPNSDLQSPIHFHHRGTKTQSATLQPKHPDLRPQSLRSSVLQSSAVRVHPRHPRKKFQPPNFITAGSANQFTDSPPITDNP
jgi:hypothetical protein